MRKTRRILTREQTVRKYWPYAVKHVAYTWKRKHPVKQKDGTFKTPFELVFGVKPEVSHLHPFGCVGYRKAVAKGDDKLEVQGAINAEIGAFEKNGTWRVVQREPGMKKSSILDEFHLGPRMRAEFREGL